MNWISNLKVKSKLAVLVTLFSLGFLIFALVAFNTLGALRIGGEKYKQIIAGKDAIADVLPPPKYIIESYLIALQMSEPANRGQVAQLAADGEKLIAEYNERQKVWEGDKLLPTPVRSAMAEASHRPAVQFFSLRRNQFLPAIQRGDYATARRVLNGPMRAAYVEHRAAVDEVVAGSIDFNRQVEQESNDLIENRSRQLLILGTIIFTLFGLGLGAMLSRSITQSLAQTINQLSTTSAQMAATIEEQERTAVVQSAAVHQTTTTMDELDASFAQTAEMVKVASEKAQGAAQNAENGLDTVRQTLEGMHRLREKVGAVSDQISNLSDQINQVGLITRVVGDLSNQTNMLALNAAVEAARAGEHGKGFGVVASEIRKLADESRKSVERIGAIVEDIKRAADTSVMATEDSAKTVEADIRLAQQTADVFGGIAQSSEVALEAAQQTLLAVPQQVAAVRQVLAAMEDLNRGAKETAEGLSQTKDSVENLRGAALQLKSMV